MSVNIASLTAVISADISGFQSGLNSVKDGLSSVADSIGSGLGTLAEVGVAAGVAVFGFGIAAVKAAADHQTAMAQLDNAYKNHQASQDAATQGIKGWQTVISSTS